jgi:acetyl-CoA acetyltransferase
MIEENCVISGVGRSAIGRRLHRDPWKLTAEACLAAIADAGLTADDIDGISTYPGGTWSTPGLTGAGVDDVRTMLGIKTRWVTGGGELASQLGSVVNAILAVGSGVCEHVLCFRTVWESTAQDQIGSRSSVLAKVAAVREFDQWTKPFGAGYPTYGALTMQRYMHESGATREQLAQIALTGRKHAAFSPTAVYREPMSLDDYMGARMISDPLCLFDCDSPTDGSVAFVVSRAGSAAIDQSRAIHIKAVGSAAGFEPCAQMMWSRTDLKPSDVKLAELYDGFSILTVRWIEALGFCPRNEGARFIEGGGRISLTGELPLNTGGGQLSGGRMHGYGGFRQACLQLRGDAGEAQVSPRPDVAVVSAGTDTFSACLLLAR